MHDIKTGMLAAQIAMNTTLSAAVSALTVFVIRLVHLRKYDIGALCNGVLAGLVSITAACGNVEAGSAIVIGGACGAWGLMAAALFDWGWGADHVHGWSGWDCKL